MPEKKFNCIPKKILYLCDDCKDGWLFNTGAVKPGIDNKPKYVHVCNKCKKMFELKKQYPTIEFVQVADNISSQN